MSIYATFGRIAPLWTREEGRSRVSLTSDRGHQGAATDPVFLNNELLAFDHAVVKRKWKFGDWCR